MLELAAAASVLAGVGFGLPALYGAWSLASGHGIARVLGFPAYGEGPFERLGVHSTPGLLVAFALVCALQCVAGALIWQGDRGGVVLGLGLLPIEALFYVGFALPFGPPLVIARTLITLIAWSSLGGG